ncbi:helix-turn-helix domain-containing protein [Microbacterium sp. P04]|uniref:helix-turn-helix domain-containing protein n=1 Tax=Microbacterium sp. P04 TaxID=3366947 RepID=UPI003744D59F
MASKTSSWESDRKIGASELLTILITRQEEVIARLGPANRTIGPIAASINRPSAGRTTPARSRPYGRRHGELPIVIRAPDGQLIGPRDLVLQGGSGSRLFCEYQRALILERAESARDAARSRARQVGRPKSMDADKIETARALIASGISRVQVAKHVGVSRASLYREILADQLGCGEPVIVATQIACDVWSSRWP